MRKATLDEPCKCGGVITWHLEGPLGNGSYSGGLGQCASCRYYWIPPLEIANSINITIPQRFVAGGLNKLGEDNAD